jgi:hypothetical protein
MWMMGYASRNKPATGTMTELWTRALVLEDAAGTRAAMITIEVSNTSPFRMLFFLQLYARA